MKERKSRNGEGYYGGLKMLFLNFSIIVMKSLCVSVFVSSVTAYCVRSATGWTPTGRGSTSCAAASGTLFRQNLELVVSEAEGTIVV